MNQLFINKVKELQCPTMRGSYVANDCIFVLKDIGDAIQEENNELREGKMNQGVHYSEMLPVEKYPSEDYLQVFHDSLNESAPEIAQYIADVSEMVLDERGHDVVLVSLARAGTPIGVLMKRYMQYQHGIDVSHYSVSIIRGKGIDDNAIAYIMNQENTENLLFVDGWTGKGAIGKVLSQSIKDFNEKYETSVSDELAVLADPAQSAHIYGTREDFFLPSACLNSIVSGLVSRTVHREDLVSVTEFHGAKYYKDWERDDLSISFVDEVTKFFPQTCLQEIEREPITMQGWTEIEKIREEFGIESINKIKPSIGETTRVLLRRVPWKILVQDKENPALRHILFLANEKNVPVEVYSDMSYACIGLIKE